jgi:hypothetical protein
MSLYYLDLTHCLCDYFSTNLEVVDFSLEGGYLVVVLFLHFLHFFFDQVFLVEQFGAKLSHLSLKKSLHV